MRTTKRAGGSTKGAGRRWTVLGSSVPRRRQHSSVPPGLVQQIEEALEAVGVARAELDEVLKGSELLAVRRRAHAQLRETYDAADALLRQAVSLAKSDSTLTWSRWRQRLSRLDAARQAQLFAEQDDSGVLPLGSVRVVDYGMAGPDIGELQHGRSRPPGTPALIGLDPDTMLRRR